MLKFFDEIFKKKKKFASPWPFSRVTDSGRGSRPVPIRGWSLPATATIPSNAPVQRPSRPSPRRGPARSLRPFRPGSRAPAKENSFNTGGLEASRAHFFTTHLALRPSGERRNIFERVRAKGRTIDSSSPPFSCEKRFERTRMGIRMNDKAGVGTVFWLYTGQVENFQRIFWREIE